MRSFITLLVACIIVACSQPSPTPHGAPDAAPDGPHPYTIDASAIVGVTSPVLRHQRPMPSGHYVPPPPDPRTPAEIAQAACQGPQGWRCPKTARKLILAATGSQPISPASWSVPNWYFDAANSTGCASDSNSCTSATCSSGGIGPCVTVQEVITHRWGTDAPILPQTTTLHLLSAETIGQETVVLEPVLKGTTTNFVIIGTPSNAGSTFSAGTVTAKSRGNPGTLLQIASMPAGAVAGQLVYNSTRSSYAFIDKMTGSTATMTQPFTASTLTTITSVPQLTEDDGWAAGNTLQLETPLLFNLKSLRPQSSDSNASFSSPVTWVQGIYFPDPAPAPGDSTVTMVPYGGGMDFSNCRFDAFLLFDGHTNVYGAGALNSWMNGGLHFDFAIMDGGASNTAANSFTRFENISSIDGDAILHGNTFVKGAYDIFGWSYTDGEIAVAHGGTMLIEPTSTLTTNSAWLWGPGSINLEGPNSAAQNVSGTTWANSLTLGTLYIDGVTTGSKYSAGTWTDGITVTSANLDTNNGLQNPRTGSRYSGT